MLFIIIVLCIDIVLCQDLSVAWQSFDFYKTLHEKLSKTLGQKY